MCGEVLVGGGKEEMKVREHGYMGFIYIYEIEQ
jgi:hypothetical protein